MRVANTLPDVNADEVLSALDADTRDYLRILLNAAGTALRDDSTGDDGQAPPPICARPSSASSPPPATASGSRRRSPSGGATSSAAIHSFQQISTELATKDKQLAELVDSANANFSAFADEEATLREALQLFPGALSQTATTLRDVDALAAELGPALEGLRPFARELAPSLRLQRPFLRETTPIIRDQIRPFARDVQPTVRDLRAATEDLAPVSPRLTRSFKVLNAFFNTLAYDPPGRGDSYLFWSGWAAHAGALLSTPQDAHGPMIRGMVLAHLQRLRPARARSCWATPARHAHPARELPGRDAALPEQPARHVQDAEPPPTAGRRSRGSRARGSRLP